MKHNVREPIANPRNENTYLRSKKCVPVQASLILGPWISYIEKVCLGHVLWS